MEILNAAFDIARADPTVLMAFRHAPQRTLFQPGERLFRFTSLADGTFEGNELFGSPWWHSRTTFNGIVRTANRTASSLIDAARAGLAVTRDWNPTMEWLATIELTKPAYGWVGPARQQQDSRGRPNVAFTGNLEQVFIPGLATPGDKQSSPYAYLSFYGSVK